MPWVQFFRAGLRQVVWAYVMKKSAGFTLIGPGILGVGTMIGSVALLSLAMRALPGGTAFLVWTGLGAVGAFGVGGHPAGGTRVFAAADRGRSCADETVQRRRVGNRALTPWPMRPIARASLTVRTPPGRWPR